MIRFPRQTFMYTSLPSHPLTVPSVSPISNEDAEELSFCDHGFDYESGLGSVGGLIRGPSSEWIADYCKRIGFQVALLVSLLVFKWLGIWDPNVSKSNLTVNTLLIL
ncbi:hypothetical protein V6N12_040943 [Hibiscus sabdariffa]|uniref:Uncharacterized protein n=1 Tax=Hibiscus sabdariffa TaxID=183260 RepID=A0ABR2E592_9ROSI